MRKQKVLFLRTQNSARSQMADSLLRYHAGDGFVARSAGCEAADEIFPYAELVPECSPPTGRAKEAPQSHAARS